MKPLVSICIPTYNGAQYLKECLDSARSQTSTDFEVLIVDDRSQDSTFSIAQAYATGDRRFRVTRNEHNLGLVGNWNHGYKVTLNYGHLYPLIARRFPTYNNPLIELVHQIYSLKKSPIIFVDVGAAIGDKLLIIL